MAILRVRIWVVFALMAQITARAQTDTLHIDEVQVFAHRVLKDLPAASIEKIDLEKSPLSTTASEGNLLQNRSNAVLRGYGPGSSVGLSIRGGTSSQSQVIINGIPFENPSLAQSDLSLLPVAAFSDVSLYRGSGSAYLGNAAVGGSLLLSSGQKLREPSASLNFTAGSFGKLGTTASVAWANADFSSNTTLYFREAQNNFDRSNPYKRNETEPQPNAYYRARGLTQNFRLETNQRSELNFFLWAGDVYRQIPPPGTKPSSKVHQEDQNARLQAGYETSLGKYEIDVGLAFDYGSLDFIDPETAIYDESQFTTLHGQLKVKRSFEIADIYIKGIYRNSSAETENYAQKQNRKSPAVIAGSNFRFFQDRTKISALLRQEWLNGERLPVLPVLSARQKITNSLSLKLAGGKTYRLPGLNDLFWNPGGNPELRPETGWFQEAGFSVEMPQSAMDLAFSATAYNRQIKNWIQWRPGSQYWSPRNLTNVQSRGIDLIAEAQNDLQVIKLDHKISAGYVQTQNTKTLFEGDRSVNKQLIYTPHFSLFGKEEISTRNEQFRLVLIGRWQSARYTTSDHSSLLDPFFTGDVELHSNFLIGKLPISLFGAVRNILDVEYQLEASRPMPGIYFNAGIQLNLNLKSNQNEK
jgi:iron complex outermembrane receptor protein